MNNGLQPRLHRLLGPAQAITLLRFQSLQQTPTALLGKSPIQEDLETTMGKPSGTADATLPTN